MTKLRMDDALYVLSSLPGPHILPHRAEVLYRHILETKPNELLELGTARGGSAVIIAAALAANGRGHLTSVESSRRSWQDPSPDEVLDRAGLLDRVTLDRSWSTYTWFLKEELEARSYGSSDYQPIYDFVFVDGAKNWTTDGLAVVLVEKLLRKDGWLLFDDFSWTYDVHTSGESMHYDVQIDQLSAKEKTDAHIAAVYELLVRTNPNFHNFVVQDNWWAWAQKR